MDRLTGEFDNLNIEPKFYITFDGIYKYFTVEKVIKLDRIARFNPYGYTTD